MIKFLVKTGDGSREVQIDGDAATIGRASDNPLKLDDKKASRKHAKIEKLNGEYRVVDLESGNGTKVNGKDVNFHVLAKGDEIQIGLSSLTVLTLDAPPKAAPSAAPVAAAVPASPAAKPEPASDEPSRPAVSRRSHYRRTSSSSGTLVALVAVVIIGGAIAYAAMKFSGQGGNLGSVGRKPADRAPRTGPTAQQAADAYADFQARASREAVSDALIADAETAAEKYGDLEPRFAGLAGELREKRSESMKSMSFAQVEPLVQAAVQERRYGDALDALKALKGGPDAEQAGKLLVQVEDKVKEEWKEVDAAGRKLQEQKQYAAAAEHYRKEAPKFRGTQQYKTIANKPEFLEQLAEAELAAAKARESKPAEAPELAKAETKPAMPSSAPAMPKPEMPKPAPAMDAPKPEMPKPAMDAPKPAMPKPEMPKPEMKPPPPPPPKPEMKEEPKKEEAKPEPARLSIKKPEVLCDCRKIAKGNYCAKCERILGPDDIRGGACKKCDEKPKKIDLCVKRYFMPDGHPEKMSDRPVIFEGKVWDMPHEDVAKIAYLCESCGEAGDLSSEIKHLPDCKSKFNTAKICSKSGTAPHAPKK